VNVAPESLRHFRMSAMEAVIGIQRYIADHPEASEGEAIDALRRSDADYAGSDYDAGLELRHLFSGSVQFD